MVIRRAYRNLRLSLLLARSSTVVIIFAVQWMSNQNHAWWRVHAYTNHALRGRAPFNQDNKKHANKNERLYEEAYWEVFFFLSSLLFFLRRSKRFCKKLIWTARFCVDTWSHVKINLIKKHVAFGNCRNCIIATSFEELAWPSMIVAEDNYWSKKSFLTILIFISFYLFLHVHLFY